MSIINSTFQNGGFLKLTNVDIVLHIENLYIFNSQFKDYDFFILIGNGFLGNLESFRNIKIKNCSFINSTFFKNNYFGDTNHIK